MIIDIGKRIYFNRSKKYKKSYFYKILGFYPKSYFGQVIARIYDFYFKNAKLLKKDFKKYYKKEFASFDEYLNKKHNLFNNEIEKLKPNIAYFSEKLGSDRYAVGGLLEYMDDNTLSEKILEILEIKYSHKEDELSYED